VKTRTAGIVAACRWAIFKRLGDEFDYSITFVNLPSRFSGEDSCAFRCFCKIDGPEFITNSCNHLYAPIDAGVFLCIPC
jgi:hypothetical protein